MKICFSCDHRFEQHDWRCPACGAAPAQRNGFAAFAPDQDLPGERNDRADFRLLAELERSNFWFCSRNELIAWASAYRGFQPASILEIGCGTGFVLSMLRGRWPIARLTGSEIRTTGLQFAAHRVQNCDLYQMDARRIPFDGEFDLIGAFDVIEHIAEDELVIAQIHQALRPQARLVLTVPQHPWLWSKTDEQAFHQRRYQASELHTKLERAGFKILHSTSFVTLLLPAMVASRIAMSHSADDGYDPVAELRIHPALNQFSSVVMSVERRAVQAGIRLPIGGSRLVIAEKPS